jgi:hypothetical protein
MVAFRLVFGLLLLASLLCFVMYLVTGNLLWRRRGVTIVKWTVIGALGFFAVVALSTFTRTS